MARFVPYEKLPKKKQHELDRQKRGSWNGINPVTRKPEDSKVYNRRKRKAGRRITAVRFYFAYKHRSKESPAIYWTLWFMFKKVARH